MGRTEFPRPRHLTRRGAWETFFRGGTQMKTGSGFVRAFFGLGSFIAANLVAQPNIQLHHDSSWEIAGRQCILRALQVANAGDQDTGPLFLSVYARGGAGYDGTGSPGVLLARAEIAP